MARRRSFVPHPLGLLATLMLAVWGWTCQAAEEACLAPPSAPLVMAADGQSLTWSGQTVPLSPPAGHDATVPLAALGRALGATVTWDAQTRTATLIWQISQAEFPADGRPVRVNGSPFATSAPVTIAGGRLFAPAPAVAQALGFQIDANDPRVWRPVAPSADALSLQQKQADLVYTLRIGPAQTLGLTSAANCDELVVGGTPRIGGPVNRAIALYVTDASGRPRVGRTVSLTLTQLDTGRRFPVAVLELYRSGEPGDDHYGNNVFLPDGRYQLEAVVDGQSVTFNFRLPAEAPK